MAKFQRREAIPVVLILLMLIYVITLKVSETQTTPNEQSASPGPRPSLFGEKSEKPSSFERKSTRRLRSKKPEIKYHRVDLPNGGAFAFLGKEVDEKRIHVRMITSEVVTSEDGLTTIRLVSKLVDIHKEFLGATVIPELAQFGDGLALDEADTALKLRQFSQSKGVDLITFPAVIATNGETSSVIVSITPEETKYVDVTVTTTAGGGTHLDIGPEYSLPTE